MARELTTSHKRAMQDGRQRAIRTRRRKAIRAVKDYRAWLAWCSNHPEVPLVEQFQRMPITARGITDADYRIAREAGAI